MKKVIIAIVVASGTITVGVLGLKSLDQYQNANQADMNDSPKESPSHQVDSKSRSELGARDGATRFRKIADMVLTSMKSDEREIDSLNTQIDGLKRQIDTLYEAKKVRIDRVTKLGKIKRVIGEDYFKRKPTAVEDVKVNPILQVESNATEDSQEVDPKSFIAKMEAVHGVAELGAIQKFNRFSGPGTAVLRQNGANATLQLNAKSILKIDDKPIRVGSDQATLFEDVATDFRKLYQVKGVRLKVSPNTPGRIVRVLSRFFKKMYDWDVEFESGEEAVGESYTVKVELFGESRKAN